MGAPARLPSPPVELRPYDRFTDQNFVFSNWVRPFAESEIAKQLGTHYMSRWTDVVRDLIDRPETTTLVATSPKDRDLICGFACGRVSRLGAEKVVHWVYVRPPARNRGVASQLLAPFVGDDIKIINTTHRTTDLTAILLQHRMRFRVRHDHTRIWLP